MSTLGEIVTVVKDTTRQGSPEVIRQIVQRCYYRICALTDWSLLQRKKLIVFGTSDSSGKLMPSDMIGITDVVPTGGSEEDRYYPGDESARQLQIGLPRWFISRAAVTPLDTLVPSGATAGVTVQKDASTFTGTLGASRITEYIRFASEPGFYLLTTAGNAFTPPYHGPLLSNAAAVVRPSSTKYLCIVDAFGNYASDSVSVFYWNYPQPLYQDWQEVLLPSGLPLELAAIAYIIDNIERKPAEAAPYRQQYEAAIRDMYVMDGKVPPAAPAPAPARQQG